MIKIDLGNKKGKIITLHKKDFGDNYIKITDELSKLSTHKNFYEYFYNGKDFTLNKIEKLICADTKKELLEQINIIEPLINKDSKIEKVSVEEIKKDIKAVFEHLFKNFSTRKWAYDFLQIVECKVCPYCNRSYTFTVRKGKYKSKPELDHYFSKNIYPYLAISIFNLIPSCSTCNKGKSDAENQYICYPYEESFDQLEKKISFTTEFDNLEAIFSDNKKLVVRLDSDDIQKQLYIDQYNSAFKIDALYEEHYDYVREIIQKAIIFDDNFFESIFSSVPELFNYSYDEVKQVIFANYLEPENMGKRPLAKMVQDILKEFYEVL
ncbi:hypothetical protein GND98_016470 [Clostridium butyricum]|uniref:Uncharacterized protein n=1 Tax=Clostridium butyricum TaxID=1492 RepID=A0A6L9ES67_CLOBU|nr:hypothetical protein [Clostridium butyricum]NAS19403.1 hypothetical protein [Clostridium butyricum]RQN09147.1 hypothetical protein EHW71_12900 [Clostridium butyricum]